MFSFIRFDVFTAICAEVVTDLSKDPSNLRKLLHVVIIRNTQFFNVNFFHFFYRMHLLQNVFLFFFFRTEYNNLLSLLYSSSQAIRLFFGYCSIVQDRNPQLYHSASRKSDCLYRPFPLTQLFSKAALPLIQYPLIALGTCLKMFTVLC